MPHEVIMPALGMAQDSGLIVAWHKAPGDAVTEGDVLFEVETDKATMEVEAQVTGILGGISANAGEEVPVGRVIALIGDEAGEEAAASGGPEQDAGPPAGNEVIMPALGMAQDTGLIVAWHKGPGDAVEAGDILFEVETDKSTMEVEAGHSGFVAALLAEAGEEAPVGEIIAIITADKPAQPLQRSLADGGRKPATAPARAEERKEMRAETRPETVGAYPSVSPPTAPDPDSRILASPKARRMALEQGLDLRRLVEAGHPQPYHAADLKVLKDLPAPESRPALATQAARRLTAEMPAGRFDAFVAWATDDAGLEEPSALLAGFAAAGLCLDQAIVEVESSLGSRSFTVPAGPLGIVAATKSGGTPDLRLRDLRASRIDAVHLGPEDVPVLTLTRAGDGVVATLECAGEQLTAAGAITLLTEFAGRMEQPLRHLL